MNTVVVCETCVFSYCSHHKIHFFRLMPFINSEWNSRLFFTQIYHSAKILPNFYFERRFTYFRHGAKEWMNTFNDWKKKWLLLTQIYHSAEDLLNIFRKKICVLQTWISSQSREWILCSYLGLEQRFYRTDPDCVIAGKPLTEFDLYISTVQPLENKGIKWVNGIWNMNGINEAKASYLLSGRVTSAGP